MKNDIINSKDLAYDYPIKPGTVQWKQLKNNEEKIKVCLIPENILTGLSTQDLLDVCLEYPLLNNIYAFTDIEQGIDKLFKDFNGIRELSKRPDALDKFINEYKNRAGKIGALNENFSHISKGKFIFGLSTIEAISSRKEFLKSSSHSSLAKLMSVLYEGYEGKKSNSDYFKGLGFQTNLLSRASLINFRNGTLADGKLGQLQFDAQAIDKIDLQSRQIIESLN